MLLHVVIARVGVEENEILKTAHVQLSVSTNLNI